ncbi:MAG: 2OG-Fe(II) oxygenase [Kofleriaceae bacterium]
MSLEGLQREIALLDENVACTGTYVIAERLSIMLPDGDVAAVDDPLFVRWLIEHGEAAPFGYMVDRTTRHDPAVRQAIRVVARGETRVGGFDPASVLPAIEQALSPEGSLVAQLTDVIVYPVGGHFALHQDTPHSPELVGTLVVGLPIEHRGGVFEVGLDTIDWSGPVVPNELRWVALFSDVYHAIKPVTGGARVTLVYSLMRTGTSREDPDRRRRMACVTRELADLELPAAGPLVIACAREVIGIDDPQPLPLSALRGVDRDLAETLLEHGFAVTVHSCLAAREVDDRPAQTTAWDMTAHETHLATLRRPFTDEDAAALLEAVTFVQASCDGGGYSEDETSDLSDRVDAIEPGNWLLRPGSFATFLAKRDFSYYGLVGNDAPETYLYKLAALEVTRR